MSPHDEKELSRFFEKKELNDDQWHIMEDTKEDFTRLAMSILKQVPPSADRSSAIRYLRLSHMQVNAAICHDWPEEPSINP